MNLSKSIDFLLDKGGDVIKYRLHKEILRDVSKTEEENLLQKVLETPNYKLVESYVKPNGYIGWGMHSWENFRDFHKETPMQDGEHAARLLSNYAIPKDSPIVKNFVSALRSDEVLKEEFSYIPPEIPRFENRYLGLGCGGGLMVLVYTCQALLGYDDEYLKPFVDISYNAFESVLKMKKLADITLVKPVTKTKPAFHYVLHDAYFPCQYHLETLAHTASWRTPEKIAEFTKAVNHLGGIMKPENGIGIKIGNRYYAPCWAFVNPLRPFSCEGVPQTACRKNMTHLAMIGGEGIEVVKKSAENVIEAMQDDGILRVKFDSAYRKKCFKYSLSQSGPYSEIGLEPNHKTDTQIWTELTFWAVQLLHILGHKI